MQSALTLSEKEVSGDARDYRRAGYAVTGNVIPAVELDAVAADIYGVFLRTAQAVGLSAPEACSHEAMSSLLPALFARDRGAYLAAAKQSQYLISVHRMGVSPPIERLLDELGVAVPMQSTRPVIHFVADGIRFEDGYHKSPIHQDWRSVQGSLDGVTLWLPLYEVRLEDFPLEVVPGSHGQGLLDSQDDAFGHRVADHQAPADDAFVALPMRRGEVVAFSGFMVHRTRVVGNDRVRIALSYRFNNAAEPSYIARGLPNPYVYRGDMTLQGLIPGPADVAPFFEPE